MISMNVIGGERSINHLDHFSAHEHIRSFLTIRTMLDRMDLGRDKSNS